MDKFLALAKLKYYALNNIIWTLFYSGCGIPYFFSEKDRKHISEISCDEDKEFIENLMPLYCLYREAKASFSEAPSSIVNPGKYVWDFNSFKKEITVSSQVFAITSMISLLRQNSITEAKDFIIRRQVKNFIDFLTAYLRNKDGLFVHAEDKTKFIGDNLKLKQNSKEFDFLDQVLVFEAIMAYKDTLKENSEKEKIYKLEGEKIFKFIYENFNIALEITTRNLSLIISSLYRASKYIKDEEMLASICELIALGCAEIESRIKISGEIEKSPINFLPASMITHFRAASGLLEGYLITKIEKFLVSGEKILNMLLETFNTTLGIFAIEDEVKYSTRDAAEVIKCLYTYYSIKKDDRLLEIVDSFISNTIEKLVQSTVERKTNINGFDIEISENIPLFSEVNLAPVFLKSINISNNLIPLSEVSKKVDNQFSIYASSIFINFDDFGDTNIGREEDDQHQLLS
ncbi:MAG: hypothetical protein N2486_09420 [Caloramator sp.]|nr:hypothetical protein [Caloramator sp.]